MGQRDAAKEKYWRSAISRWQESGLTVRDFCEQEKIEKSKFAYWRGEIRRRDYGDVPRPGKTDGKKTDKNPLFVPLKVGKTKKAAKKSKQPLTDCIEIQTPGGYSVKVSSSADAKALGLVLAALKENQC